MKQKKDEKLTLEEIRNLDEEERRKYEIAEELGLLDKVLTEGWRGLSSKETGKIGGIMSKKRREYQETSQDC